jgi:hypothetical protein
LALTLTSIALARMPGELAAMAEEAALWAPAAGANEDSASAQAETMNRLRMSNSRGYVNDSLDAGGAPPARFCKYSGAHRRRRGDAAARRCLEP